MNATGVTAGPAESNGSLLLGIWRDSLHVTWGLTACTPGSAPGPTLGNEYGKTCLFCIILRCVFITSTEETSLPVNVRIHDTTGRTTGWSKRFYRAMLCIRGTSHGPVSVCPSVCLSVTSRCSTKTAKRRITQTTPHDSAGSLVF